MNPGYRSILVAISISAAPLVTYAEPLECHGDIVSQGDAEEQLLEVCGNPHPVMVLTGCTKFPGPYQ